jgi:hypothetical protein
MNSNKLSTNQLFWIVNIAWMLLNMLQAGVTELANDEAYYVMFAQNMDWGYYDHPPMIALFIYLGQWVSGELGVRLLTVLSQPIYLWLFWKIIAPPSVEKKDVWLFFLIAMAMPILHIYGFVAVPDGPFLLFSMLFLYLFVQYIQHNSWQYVVLMALAIAAIGYSKYTGVLVVLFACLAYPRVALRKSIYLTAILSLLVMLPHFYWQYQHDWVSFQYHLVGRNQDFNAFYIAEYLANFIAVFNPFILPIVVWIALKNRHQELHLRLLKRMALFFFVFFFVTCIRGHVQPQWFIFVAFSVIAVAWHWARNNEKAYRYIRIVSIISIALLVGFRVFVATNPLGMKAEVFNNKAKYQAIADATGNLPVMFMGKYTEAAKYTYYTGLDAHASPNIHFRTSQYQLWNIDSKWIEKPVAIHVGGEYPTATHIQTAGGQFSFVIDSCYMPVRDVHIEWLNPMKTLPLGTHQQTISISIYNPYPYDIVVDNDHIQLHYVVRKPWSWVEYTPILMEKPLVLKSLESSSLQQSITIDTKKANINETYESGFILTKPPYTVWYNSTVHKIKIQE